MKKSSKSMMNFALALIALVIAVQVAWAMLAPIIGYIVLGVVVVVLIWFAVPRIFNALNQSGRFEP